MKKTLVGMSSTEMESLAVELGLQRYRGRQIARWIYQRRAASFEEMTDLGRAVREHLIQACGINPLHEMETRRHGDGTLKYLLRLPDGECVETVRLLHPQWETICVSTQVGCPIGCTFCASGQSYVRNLHAGEIVGQVLLAQSEQHTNIVFMGMGEPFLNTKELFRSFELLNSEVGIGARNLTVSTVGIIKGILDLAALGLEVNLGISLHAPNDKLRRQLIGTHAPGIQDIFRACSQYFQKTGRRISFEYILLSEVNDLHEHAISLARLLQSCDFKFHVNLIPYNETRTGFKRSSLPAIRAFKQCLEEHGLSVTIRREKGKRIEAACGQLRRQHLQGETPPHQ